MGHSLTHVGFFSEEIKLLPHTASLAEHIGKPITLRRFAKNQPLSLQKRDDNDEFIATRYYSGEFIEGPSV